MFDLTHFFISTAWAQNAAPAPQAAPTLMDIVSPQTLMIIALFGVWFFLVIRPQNKKYEEQNKMIKALQRGDRIVTSGGIHGKIAKVEGDNLLIVEIADGVQIKLDRNNVQGLEAKTQPVPAAAEEADKK